MKRAFTAFCMLLFSAPAAAYSCTGTVNYLGLSNDGTVEVDNGNGIWAVCSLSGTYGSTTTEACAAWYSGMLTARAGARTITIYFAPSDNAGIATCAGLGNWAGRYPYFVQLD